MGGTRSRTEENGSARPAPARPTGMLQLSRRPAARPPAKGRQLDGGDNRVAHADGGRGSGAAPGASGPAAGEVLGVLLEPARRGRDGTRADWPSLARAHGGP